MRFTLTSTGRGSNFNQLHNLNRIAVLLASATPNITNLPAGWPVETRPLDDGEEAAAPWVEMTEDQLAAQFAEHHAAKETWNAAQATAHKSWSAKEFLDRFTVQELAGFEVAQRTDPILAVLLRKLSASTEVHSDNAELLAGFDYVVAQGLLTPERRAEILA